MVFAFFRVVSVAIAVAIVCLSLAPEVETPPEAMDLFSIIARAIFGTAEESDKVAHFVAYAALGFSSAIGWGRSLVAYAFIAASLIVGGTVMEIIQGLIGYRQADALDFAANTFGVFFGLLAGSFALRFMPQPRRRRWPTS